MKNKTPKLYKVEIEKHLYVIAYDEEQAEYLGTKHVNDECSEYLAYAYPISDIDKSNEDILYSLPWPAKGITEELTIAEWLEKLKDSQKK